MTNNASPVSAEEINIIPNFQQWKNKFRFNMRDGNGFSLADGFYIKQQDLRHVYESFLILIRENAALRMDMLNISSSASGGLNVPEGWNPIETAPKNKRILVWTGQEIYAAHWAKNMFTDDEAWIVAAWGTERDQALVHPTHWAPLPALSFPAAPTAQADHIVDANNMVPNPVAEAAPRQISDDEAWRIAVSIREMQWEDRPYLELLGKVQALLVGSTEDAA